MWEIQEYNFHHITPGTKKRLEDKISEILRVFSVGVDFYRC